MKNLLLLLGLLFLTVSGVHGQTQIYSQNFSDTSGTLPAGWTNTGTCLWASSLDNPSMGYTGSSGGRNGYTDVCTGSAQMQVAFINTLGYDNIKILWGARKTGSDINSLEWSSDGSTWNPVAYTDVASNSTWALVNSGVPIPLPGAGGFANLRVRWTITNPSDYRMDDFVVQGTSVPTKLKIVSVTGSTCFYPIQGDPFTVNVVSQNAGGVQVPVTAATTVQLSLVSGSLSGTVTGVIPSGQSSVSISGVVFNSIGLIQIIASVSSGPPLTSYTTNPIEIRGPLTGIAFANLSGTGTTNNNFPGFKVTGVQTGGNPDSSCFSGSVTISVNSVTPAGGTITGTLTQNAIGGAAHFNNIIFTQAGTYTLKAVSSGFPDIISSPIVITDGPVTLVDLKVPLYMQGETPLNNERLFTAFLVEIQNLIPNATYKYYNRVVTGSDLSTADGTGNVIFANSSGFTRTTNPNFTSSGDYATFQANGTGRFTGWFVVEPSDDSRFTPGNDVKMRIMLNDGTGGTTVDKRLTTTRTTRILDLGSGLTQGSFISALAPSGYTPVPKNFLLLYKGDTTGTGNMPVSITVVESDGLALTSPPYLSGYVSGVDGINHSAGTIIPNQNPSGITRIEELGLNGPFDSFDNPVLQPISIALSPNGVWPPGVDTRNPTNGITPISIQPVYILTNITQNGIIPGSFELLQNYPNPFNPLTVIKFNISNTVFVKVTVYDMLGREVVQLVNEELSPGSYSIDFNASAYPSGMYFYKLEAGDFTGIKKMVLIK